VVIDGLILKHKGELVAIDADEVIRKAAELFALRANAPVARISTRIVLSMTSDDILESSVEDMKIAVFR